MTYPFSACPKRVTNRTYKNPTQILREMSAAWQEMTDIERSAALELMGGKRQAKPKNCLNVQKCASTNTFNCR